MCGLCNGIVSHATFILLDVITVALYSPNKLVVPSVYRINMYAFFPSFFSYQSTYLASLASFLPTDKQILYQVFWHLQLHAKKVVLPSFLFIDM